MYSNLKRGNIDLINTSNIDYETYIGTIGFNVNVSPDREFDYILINNMDSVLSRKEVRQAINYAIDKNNIVYNIYKNKYLASNFPLDNGSYLCNNENSDQTYNLDKARSILTDNGWVYQNNIWRKSGTSYRLNFDLVVNSSNANRVLVAENIKEQLDKIGININVIKVGDNSFQNYIKNKNYELILTGNIVPLSPDLNSYLGENNLSNYSNDEMNGLLKEVNDIQDENLLKEKYKRIIEIYNDDVPFISLYFNPNISIASPNIKGVIDHNWYDMFYHIDEWYKTK